MWALREQKHHKAKKVYDCDTCGQIIEIGESYVRQRETDMHTGERITTKYHEGEKCNPHHDTKKLSEES